LGLFLNGRKRTDKKQKPPLGKRPLLGLALLTEKGRELGESTRDQRGKNQGK